MRLSSLPSLTPLPSWFERLTACAGASTRPGLLDPVRVAVRARRLAADAEWAQRRVDEQIADHIRGVAVALGPPIHQIAVDAARLLGLGPLLPGRHRPEQPAFGFIAHRGGPGPGEYPAEAPVGRLGALGDAL